MPWDSGNVGRLRDLWDQGLPTAQIGKLLGFTKNAVVGKAHRIGLERRPSPIRRTAVKPDRKKARSPVMPKLNFEINSLEASIISLSSNGNFDSYSNEHPIVRTNPDSGKKALYVNYMYTRQIVGMDKEESDALLKKIYQHQERLDLTCRFKWTPNAVAIWDNRSVIHYAIADFFPNRGLGYRRIMDRTSVRGEKPF